MDSKKSAPKRVADIESVIYVDYPTHSNFGVSAIPYRDLERSGDVGRGVIRGYFVFGFKSAMWYNSGKAEGRVYGPRFIILLHSSQANEVDDRLEVVVELNRAGIEYVNKETSFRRRYVYLTLGTSADAKEIYHRSLRPLRLASWAAKRIGPALEEYFESVEPKH